MNSILKKTIESVLIILVVVSAISLPDIYPICLSIAVIVFIILERETMNKWTLGISCVLWMTATVIYLIKYSNQ